MTSPVGPFAVSAPISSRMARLVSPATVCMLWLTNRTVRPAFGDVLHLAQALLLERGVADGEHFVDDQDLRLQVGGHRESQPHVHPAGVALDRRVEELLDLGEVDDLVELAPDLRPRACPRIAPLR